jgi:IS1 family transposase
MAEHNQLKRLEAEIYYTAETDELRSYAGRKSSQRRTWYAMDKNTGVILARHNGKRSDEDLQLLVKYLESIPVDV